MDIRVLEPVADVALVGVEHHQATVMEDPEALGRLAVVLVDFRQAGRKRELYVEDRVVEGYLAQIALREYLLQLTPDVPVLAATRCPGTTSALLVPNSGWRASLSERMSLNR
mgnify:CR=1 FL=1